MTHTSPSGSAPWVVSPTRPTIASSSRPCECPIVANWPGESLGQASACWSYTKQQAFPTHRSPKFRSRASVWQSYEQASTECTRPSKLEAVGSLHELGSQSSAESEPNVLVAFPEGHCWQLVLPSSLLYRPTGQKVQPLLPLSRALAPKLLSQTDAKEPAGQSKQSCCDRAPGPENLPAGHAPSHVHSRAVSLLGGKSICAPATAKLPEGQR